ncbi:hypothetical protein B0H67DRAFT_639810 [Lasiosphaeris hirsuta]|uniref:Uncharacterized protein n=1 Tax=Lasiosphaeris hirsuta TaxID=260670 RepID=A0AA40EAS6_9PEZI|nr:hypothetical protein B0H67DRAFT_639810 [Lasiosphaeris hirsuta]
MASPGDKDRQRGPGSFPGTPLPDPAKVRWPRTPSHSPGSSPKATRGSRGSRGSRVRWPRTPLSPGSSLKATRGTRSKERKTVDGAFIEFLIGYAANNPECSPLFRGYLENVVLKPRSEDERISLVNRYLGNPEIADYGLGPEFMAEIQKYNLYDMWRNPEERSNSPRFHEVMEQDFVDTGELSDGHSPDSTDEEGGEASDGEETEEGSQSEEARENSMEEWQKRLKAVLGDEDGAPEPRKPVSRMQSSASDPTEYLLNLLETLQSVPPIPIASIYSRSGAAQAGDSALEERTGPDWAAKSWFRGTPQPPIATRLQTIVNFLGDEDVDRCLDWKKQFQEVVSYLSWLAKGDDKRQLEKVSPRTRAIYDEAVTMAKAHVLFERHHYTPTPLELGKPPRVPLRSTRLNWTSTVHDWPVPSSRPVPRRDDLPRPLPPRGLAPVSKMLVDDPRGDHMYNMLVQHGKAYWSKDNDIQADDQNNLACIEAQAFKTFSALGSAGGVAGGVRRDPDSGMTVLPDGTPVIPSDPAAWAQERGARRAGLQQCLRRFGTQGHLGLPAKGCGLVLPMDAATQARVVQSVQGLQYAPVGLPATEMPRQIEPQPYGFFFGEYEKQRRRLRKMALLQVTAQYRDEGHSVTLPKNLVTGGPLIWPTVDPDVQNKQELLEQCRTALKVLEAASQRAPRDLLRAALDLAKRGVAGEFESHMVPREVHLAKDEWWRERGKKQPSYLSSDDTKWIKFLGGRCANDQNWTGRVQPDTPRDMYRLFHIFARRVKKTLDDRNPEGLFSRSDSKVTVEQLLEVINAGSVNSAIEKCEFHPYDACAWLDRLAKAGQVRFQPDLECYGVIERPVAQYFPEHRVIWPRDNARPSYPRNVSGWERVIRKEDPTSTGRGTNVWNFFTALGYRLGYTIRRLERSLAREAGRAQHVSTQELAESISRWEEVVADLQRGEIVSLPELVKRIGVNNGDYTDGMTEQEALPLIRTKIIEEIYENKPMLAPGREYRYIGWDGEEQAALVRDFDWDWASKRVRGGKCKRFWDVNRWPLQSGYLNPEAENAIKNDVNLDPAQTFDPFVTDPTPDHWKRPKLRRYGEEDKVEYRRGPAIYPIGDTVRQRKAVEDYMTEMVHRSVGLDRRRKRTWSERLALLNPFSSSDNEGRPTDPPPLPPVDPRLIPESWDPRVMLMKMEEDADVEGAEDDDDDDDDYDEMDDLLTVM